jgi:predicted nucleic acid-binding protein
MRKFQQLLNEEENTNEGAVTYLRKQRESLVIQKQKIREQIEALEKKKQQIQDNISNTDDAIKRAIESVNKRKAAGK